MTPPPDDRRPPVRGPVAKLELEGVRRGVLVALVVAALVPVAIVALLLFSSGGSTGSQSPTTAAQTKTTHIVATTALTKATIAHDPLAKAVAGINVSDTAKGMLPLSACKLTNSTTVTCTQPTPAVDVVIFRTYSSSQALYAAYEARVSAIAGSPFKSNYGNCTETRTSGEVGWNHNFQHPTTYPMSEFSSGQITDDKAAGRVYCTFNDSDLYLVWTQDDGHVMGELSGAPHVDAYVWWRQVHHSVVMPGSPSMMMSMTGPTATTSSTSTMGTTSTMSTATTTSTMNMPSTKGMTSTTSTSMH